MVISLIARTPRFALYGTKEHDFVAIDVVSAQGTRERAFFGVPPQELDTPADQVWCVPHKATGAKVSAVIMGFMGAKPGRTLGEYLRWVNIPLADPDNFVLREGVIQWELHRVKLLEILHSGDRDKHIWLPGLRELLYGEDGEVSEEKYADVSSWAMKRESDLTFVEDVWGIEGSMFILNQDGQIESLAGPWAVAAYDDDE